MQLGRNLCVIAAVTSQLLISTVLCPSAIQALMKCGDLLISAHSGNPFVFLFLSVNTCFFLPLLVPLLSIFLSYYLPK